MKSDCQQRAQDMRRATGAGRPFVDKSGKVTALQNTDETPPVASVTLASDFDEYLFAITMDSSWSDTLCSLVRPPATSEYNADVSWSLCLLADRLGVCSHGLPARLVCEHLPAADETVALSGRRREPGQRTSTASSTCTSPLRGARA